MRTKKINIRDFDFKVFLDSMIFFIEANFGTDSPDAADTMRYFYSFDNELNKSASDKDTDKWQMTDFKEAILQGGEVVFFPFSSGPNLDGSVALASGEIMELAGDDEEDAPRLGLTDCFGLLVNLEKDKFKFNSAIAWGDTVHAVECASHPKIDRAMSGFLKKFIK